MARSSRLPRITECTATAPRRASLSDRRIIHGVFFCLLVCGLGVAHVALRFAINDMEVQHARLQGFRQTLENEQKALQHSNAVLGDPDRLNDFARRELAMVDVGIESRRQVPVPDGFAVKYSAAPAASEPVDSREVLAGMPEIPGKSLLLSLIDTNKAFAATASK